MSPNSNGTDAACRPITEINGDAKPATAKKPTFGPPMFVGRDEFESPSILVAVTTYLSFAILILMGHLRDFLRHLGIGRQIAGETGNKGFVPLYADFESFFTRHLYRKIRDCWNRPIKGEPARFMELIDRVSDDYNWTFRATGTTTKVLNLASYNYLGFASGTGICADYAIEALKKYGAASCSPSLEMGTYALLEECECLVAKMVGKEAAVVVGMGFATNSTILPCLVDNQCLILSDANNHSSLVLGARLSGARIQVFKHNDMADLESLLERAIVEGQPRTHRPYKKILIMVEGLYSMEGTVCALADIVALKKKYKAYIYLDEAHSIGALGPTGRGICECWGVDPADVDCLMGTFTKSFGSAGGYVASSKAVVDAIRAKCHSTIYATSMAAPVAAQIIAAINVINGTWEPGNGEKRLRQLHENSRYFRKKLIEMGFIVYGVDDSPVVPMLVFQPGKVAPFSRELRARGVGVVVVGYPAVTITTSRVRFCMSAAHTREDLKAALRVLSDVGDMLHLKQSQQPFAKANVEL